MNLTPEAEIAQFLRRLKYILFAGLIGWVVWLLAPILTPFVLALALAWLGDPLVDRIEATGRSRMTGVVLVFAAMVLVIVALLLVLVPMIERQITTLIAVAPDRRGPAGAGLADGEGHSLVRAEDRPGSDAVAGPGPPDRMGAQPLAAGRRLRHHVHGLCLAFGLCDGDLGGQHPASADPGVLLPA